MTATEELAESQARTDAASIADAPAEDVSDPKPAAAPPADDLDVGMSHFREVLMKGMPEKKKETAKTEVASIETGKNTEPKTATAAPSAPVQPEKKPVKVTRKTIEPPRPSMEEIAAEAAARTIAAMRPAQQEPAKTEPAAVPKAYAKQMAVFNEMAASKPEAYSDLPGRLRTFILKEDAYIEKWQTENLGKDFDSANEEHNDFYKRHEPAYDDDDFDAAKTQIATKPLLEQESKKIRAEMGDRFKRVEEIEAKEIERSLIPLIHNEQKSSMGKILGAINPEYESIAENAQNIEKLSTDDPAAYELAMQTAHQTLPFVAEVVKLWDGEGKIKADMENPLHRHIYDYERDIAKRIKSLPQEDQSNASGQRFASWSEYQSLSSAEQKKRWVLGRNELIHVRQHDAISYVSGVMRLAKGLSNGNGDGKHESKTSQTDTKTPPKVKPEQKQEERVVEQQIQSSPSMSGKTNIATTGPADGKASENWADKFNSVLSGRKF